MKPVKPITKTSGNISSPKQKSVLRISQSKLSGLYWDLQAFKEKPLPNSPAASFPLFSNSLVLWSILFYSSLLMSHFPLICTHAELTLGET